jgi:phosphatidate cytidylyltransferase
MLRQRVITALIIIGAFVAVLVLAPFPVQALLFALVACAGAWEWSALVGCQSLLARAAYAAVVPLLSLGLWVLVTAGNIEVAAAVRPWLASAAMLWSVMLLALKSYPAGEWFWGRAWIRGLLGWLMLTMTWAAVAFCLTLTNGPLMVFLMMLTVAAADIGAYFAGKQLGRHALALAISPSKTWEGFWGGMVCVAALVFIIWNNLPPSYLHLDLGSLLALGLLTGGASVVGDLTVSALKREAGVKDSGSLLPGHGGLLDRLDSICGAAPIFALGLLLVGY